MNGSPAANDAVAPTVDVDVSDLFFNRDVDAARIVEKGEFVGWNESVLRDEAVGMLGSLKCLGVTDLPEPDDLVADFLDRV